VSVGDQDRQGHRVEHILRGSPEDHLPQAGVTVGTHDDEVAAELDCACLDDLRNSAVSPFGRLGAGGEAVAAQVMDLSLTAVVGLGPRIDR